MHPAKQILIQWIFQCKLTEETHKEFAKWFGVYEPIIAKDRELAAESIDVLFSNIEDSHDIFNAWLDANILEINYTIEEQIEVSKFFD